MILPQPEDAWTLGQHGLPQQLLNNPCPKIHLQTVSTLIDKHIPVSEHCFIFVHLITFILHWSLWTHIVRSSEVPLPMYTLSTCAPVNPSLVQDKYQLLPISSLKYYHQDVISFHTLLLLILSSQWHTDLWTPRSHLKSKVLTSPSRSCRKKFFGRSPSKTALTSGLRWKWIDWCGDWRWAFGFLAIPKIHMKRIYSDYSDLCPAHIRHRIGQNVTVI